MGCCYSKNRSDCDSVVKISNLDRSDSEDEKPTTNDISRIDLSTEKVKSESDTMQSIYNKKKNLICRYVMYDCREH